MPKSVGVYLGEQALRTLEQMKQMQKALGTDVSDSSIIADALMTHAWYVSNTYRGKQAKPICPKPSCGAEIENRAADKCDVCGTPILWAPVIDTLTALEPFVNQIGKSALQHYQDKEKEHLR